MTERRLIVGIGGTTRPGSSSEKLLRAVLADAEAAGAQTILFCGPDLAKLPHFAPHASQRTPEQTALVDAVRRADGIVIATPGYHGGVSGLVKNAIDLLEDLREDSRSYFEGRPVGLIVTAGGWQACGVTLSALRDVVHALRGWPTPLGIAINSSEPIAYGADGTLEDGPLRDMVRSLAGQVMMRIGVGS
jgi:FMN reductase